jgi:predicted DNA-binding protein
VLASHTNHHMVYTSTVLKLRTNIYLTPDQMKKLKLLNEKTGAPVAELVRRAVDEYLKQRAKELK